MDHTSESKSETKNQIAKVAIKLFLKKGVANTSMRELAKTFGFTTGGLYYYFTSKDEIINLVADVAINSVQDTKDYYKSLGKVTRSEAVKACSRYWFNLMDQRQDYQIFYTRETLEIEPGRRQAIMQSVREFIRFIAKLLDEGIKSGEFVKHDSQLVAFNIWALHNEWALRRWLLRNMYTNDQYIDKQIDLTMRQISNAARPS